MLAQIPHDAPPHSLKDLNASPRVKTMEEKGVRVRSLTHNILGVEGHARVPKWGFGQVISGSIIHMNLHKLNNKLVNVWLEHFWCTYEPRTYTDSQASPQLGLKGSHHLPPYSILYAWSWGLHPNVILLEVPKFFKLGLSQL